MNTYVKIYVFSQGDSMFFENTSVDFFLRQYYEDDEFVDVEVTLLPSLKLQKTKQ